MKTVELLKDSQLKINEAIKYLEEHSLDSILKYFSLANEVAYIRNITSYQNESKTLAMMLLNEEIRNTGFNFDLEKTHTNSGALTLEYKGRYVASVNLYTKNLYHFQSTYKDIYSTIRNIKEVESELEDKKETISTLNAGVEELSGKLIYKFKRKTLQEIVDKNKIQVDKIQSKIDGLLITLESHKSSIELNKEVQKNIHKVIIKLNELGFTSDYYDLLENKHYRVLKKPQTNISYSSSVYENDNIVIINMSENSEEDIVEMGLLQPSYNQEYIKDIVNAICEDITTHTITTNAENSETWKGLYSVSFYKGIEEDSVRYVFDGKGDIFVTGFNGHLYDLIDHPLFTNIKNGKEY